MKPTLQTIFVMLVFSYRLIIGLALCCAELVSRVWLFATPWTIACQAPLSVHGDSPGKQYWSGLPCPPPGDLPNTRIKPRSPALQVDSLPSEPPGKPMNTWVGSLSLLQGIFLTQELRQGLLHCRPILYQLSYEGCPLIHQGRRLCSICSEVHYTCFCFASNEIF